MQLTGVWSKIRITILFLRRSIESRPVITLLIERFGRRSLKKSPSVQLCLWRPSILKKRMRKTAQGVAHKSRGKKGN